MTLPHTPAEITPEWLTGALSRGGVDGPAVTGFDVENIGEGTGIFGEIVRLVPSYDGDAPDAPATIIAKLPCVEPANLAVAQALGIYQREVRFFETIAPTAPFRAPACYFSQLDDDGRFVLLLEDLSVDYEVGDQVVGITPEQADPVVDALAGFHAAWWETDELHALDWVPVPNAPAYAAAVPDIYSAGLPVLEAEWPDRLPGGAIDVARRLEPGFAELLQMTAQGPTTFIHTDTRLDNIFFARDGSGIALIDFQLMLRGRGVADIAYLVGTSMNVDDQQEHWERLVRRWHSQIAAAGIDYPLDDCLTHYRQAALYYLSGAMSLIGSFDTGNERGAALTAAYVTRIFNHVIDIDAESALDRP